MTEKSELPDDETPLTARARRRLFFRSLLVGLSAGVLAVAFRFALEQAEPIRNAIFTANELTLVGALLSAGFSLVVISLAVFVVQRFAPEAAGSGIPHVEGVLHHGLPIRWVRVIIVKTIGGVLAIGGGLTLGREGPTVQLGAAAGEGVGRAGRSHPEERRSLIAIGAGAGLAATFNAPLAGMAFVFEELRGGFRPGDFLAALLATATADFLSRSAFGQGPIFGTLSFIEPALSYLPLAMVLGIIGGIAGVLLNAGIVRSVVAVGGLRNRWLFVAPFAIVIGLCGWWWLELVGDGHSLLGRAFRDPPVPLHALVIAAGYSLLVLGSYACGAAGGLFSPILALGAYIGVACGGFTEDASHATLAVVLGMAAIFTGSIRAPVTGTLLMVEMTGSYVIILPLLAAVLAAEYVAGELGGEPIYSELLEMSLARSRDAPQ